MNWLSFHVASGASLFSGALFLTLGVVLAGAASVAGGGVVEVGVVCEGAEPAARQYQVMPS